MPKVNKKTLAAQSAQAQETANRQTRAEQANQAALERQRGTLASGLGSAEQLSGAYGDVTPRDLSQYSSGLTVGGQKFGTESDALRKLSKKNSALYGQVTEVQGKYQASYDAAKSGDYALADQLRGEADALTKQYGLNDPMSPQKGFTFGMGDRFDPLHDNEAEAQAKLGSAGGVLVGGVVNRAREMLDPNSAESMRFKDSISSGALAAVDQSRDTALRAMASQERTAARGMRDMALQSGAAGQTVKMAAVAARSSERFATMRADLEGGVAAAKAQIHSEAAKLYESFSTSLAADATALSSAWINDQSGVRDSFRQLTSNIMMNYTSNLFQMSQSAMKNATDMAMQEKELAAQKSQGAMQLAGTVVGAGLGAVCWVADVLFGAGSPDAQAARYWCLRNLTHPFVRLYVRRGRVWAAWLAKHRWAQPLVRPIWAAMARAGRRLRALA